MKNRVLRVFTCLSLAASFALGGLHPSTARAADLRKAAAVDSFLTVWGAHNSERDYQKVHFDRVWKAVKDAEFPATIRRMMESRVPEDNIEAFDQVMGQLQKALDPVDWEALANAKQVLYQQFMEASGNTPIMAQQVVMMELEEGKASQCAQGFVNLMEMAEQASNGRVTVSEKSFGGGKMWSLSLPAEAPFSPNIAVIDDILMFSTSAKHARKCASLLADGGLTKFDDPRFKSALKKLPKAEDMVTIFDARDLFAHLDTIPDFIIQKSRRNEEATKAAAILADLIDQFSCLDYEVTVGYTEGNQNRTASYGRLLKGYEDKVLGKMATNAPVKDWYKWVPEEASSFSINSGVNLMPLYTWARQTIPKHIPEASEAFVQLEELEKQYDVNLEDDILANFSGAAISITMPGGAATPLGQAGQGVTAIQCRNPDRMRELMHRGVEIIADIPQLQQFGVSLDKSTSVEGFEDLNVNALAMMGLRPTIGFKDGWMIIGSSGDAVKTVLATRDGDHESFKSTSAFKQFNLEVADSVNGITYADIGAQIRGASQMLMQVGIIAPTFMAMAPPEAKEQLEPVRELLTLLPKISRIVKTFDFYEKQISVIEEGDEPGSWKRSSVLTIRMDDAEESN